ncbi:MAG: tRNA pseudouridine(55) synthase, partial [Parcubacteria group bacterium QH_9_35_7]
MVLLDKPISLTPLQTIEKFKEQNPKYKDKKMSYAGRLDPMAEGLLLCLVGEENKNREEYQQLEK